MTDLFTAHMSVILGDLLTFHLAFFGLCLTLFTVLYSFILNKRDELRTISSQIKYGEITPLLSQQESFAVAYIKNLQKVNSHLILLTVVTFFLFLCSWLLLRFPPTWLPNVKLYCFYGISFLSILSFLYIILVLYQVLNYYFKSIRL